MTTTFPFETATPVEPAEPLDAVDQARSRRPLLVGGGLLGALVLAAGGWFFLHGSSDATSAGARLVVQHHKPAVAAPPAAAAPAAPVPAATTDHVGRNPFKALYVAPAAAAPGTTTSTTGTASGATSGTTSTAPKAGSTTSTTSTSTTSTTKPTSATPSPQPSTPPKYLTVKVVDPTANQVTFTLVDRTVSDPAKAQQNVVVKPGEVFATYFKLLGYGTVLDAGGQPRNCTDLQYGENRLKLCQGESYQVG
jgi:hypothetical protein